MVGRGLEKEEHKKLVEKNKRTKKLFRERSKKPKSKSIFF